MFRPEPRIFQRAPWEAWAAVRATVHARAEGHGNRLVPEVEAATGDFAMWAGRSIHACDSREECSHVHPRE